MASDIIDIKTVIAIQGNPVSNTTPSIGQYLGWDGYQWTPTNLPSSLPPSGSAGGDLSGIAGITQYLLVY